MKHIISLGAGVQKRGRRGRVDEGTDKGGRVTEKKPICYELFAGLFGWGAGFIAEGYKVIGFDIMDVSAELGIPRAAEGCPLIIRDVRSVHGSELADAAVIVASPPCQAYSYRAMPWKRAKALGPPDNTLFNECFRIQREANEASGRYIPMVVENVRGAQPWVGKARYHYGSFYLWGDVPALMPITLRCAKVPGLSPGCFPAGGLAQGKLNEAYKSTGMNWSDQTKRGQDFTRIAGAQNTSGHVNIRDGHGHTRHLTNQAESDAVKQPGIGGPRTNGKGDAWFQDGAAQHGSKSKSRKAASAMIAQIPFALAVHIARCYKPLAPE